MKRWRLTLVVLAAGVVLLGGLWIYNRLSEREGIIPALESSHALGWLMRNGASMRGVVVVNLSGRGDKDVPQVAALESR